MLHCGISTRPMTGLGHSRRIPTNGVDTTTVISSTNFFISPSWRATVSRSALPQAPGKSLG